MLSRILCVSMYRYLYYTYTDFLHPLFSCILLFQSNTSWLSGLVFPSILLCKLAYLENSLEGFHLGTGES